MYLVDTNIFLEILLKQEKSEACKNFLDENIGLLHITDYSLHSIGVILFKLNEDSLFVKFLKDTLLKTQLISLPKNEYQEVVNNRKQQKLDFDDAYQYSVCKHYEFKLVTMDQDFRKAKNIEVLFI